MRSRRRGEQTMRERERERNRERERVNDTYRHRHKIDGHYCTRESKNQRPRTKHKKDVRENNFP